MNNGQALTDMNLKLQVEDPIVLKVLSKYYERSQLGIKKYGRTLDRDDLRLTDWLNHLQEEMMDATLYIEKLKADLKQAQKAALIDLMNSEYDEMLNDNKDKG
jgi:methylaspartate ammonia-lyase